MDAVNFVLGVVALISSAIIFAVGAVFSSWSSVAALFAFLAIMTGIRTIVINQRAHLVVAQKVSDDISAAVTALQAMQVIAEKPERDRIAAEKAKAKAADDAAYQERLAKRAAAEQQPNRLSVEAAMLEAVEAKKPDTAS